MAVKQLVLTACPGLAVHSLPLTWGREKRNSPRQEKQTPTVLSSVFMHKRFLDFCMPLVNFQGTERADFVKFAQLYSRFLRRGFVDLNWPQPEIPLTRPGPLQPDSSRAPGCFSTDGCLLDHQVGSYVIHVAGQTCALLLTVLLISGSGVERSGTKTFAGGIS